MKATIMPKIPDQETHMAEVKQLAQEAREAGAPMTSGSAAKGRLGPLTLAPAHEGVPTEYIIHIHTQHCQNCECSEEYSEFFAHYRMRSRTGVTTLSHKRRCDKPMYNLPIRRIALQATTVPFCSECEIFDLTHLPAPPEEATAKRPVNISKTDQPKAARQDPAAKPPKKKWDLKDLV